MFFRRTEGGLRGSKLGNRFRVFYFRRAVISGLVGNSYRRGKKTEDDARIVMVLAMATATCWSRWVEYTRRTNSLPNIFQSGAVHSKMPG